MRRPQYAVCKALLGAALAMLMTAGCGGVDATRGLDAWLRVAGGQFFSGELPVTPETSGAGAGPHVLAIDSLNNTVRPGQRNKGLSGRVDPEAQAVALALDGDAGYWTLPVGSPDLVNPGSLSWSARVDLSSRAPLGTRPLRVAAVTPDGHFGPASDLNLRIQGDAPDGALVITLAWENETDLDLHVVTPDGTEVWARNLNTYQPPAPGEPYDPAAVLAGGWLDQDSNSQCVLDGRRRESVAWKQAPPAGHYLVRVDAFSLCGQAQSRWTVRATLRGEELGSASGVFVESDTRFAKRAGGGLLALELDVPDGPNE